MAKEINEEQKDAISRSIPDAVFEWVSENTKIKNGELKYKSGNGTNTVTWENINRKLMPLRMAITLDQLELITDTLIEAHNASKVQYNTEDYFDSPVDFCRHYMSKWQVNVAGDGTMLYANEHAGEVPLTKAELVNRLKLELFSYNRSIPYDPETKKPVVPPLTATELIQCSAEIIISEVRYRAIGRAREAIQYNPRTDFPLDEWVIDLLDIYGIDHLAVPSHITMFKHLLYSIKRGVFNIRDNERRPMHVFYSRKQGTGKTTLLEKLCTPFKYAYSENGKIHKLLDGKAFKAMVRDKALVDFQELAVPLNIKNSRGEVDYGIIADVKSALSSKTVAERGLFTAENESEVQYAAFASSSNQHIFDVLQDPGGMRRYWEYQLEPKQDNRTRWDSANRLFAAMEQVYQCIDENDPLGYYHDDCSDFDAISKIQDTYSKADAFSKFTELSKLSVQSFPETGYTRTIVPVLVKRFNRWQEKQGNKAWSATAVLTLMSQKDIIPVREEIAGKIEEVVYIAENM